MATQQYEELDLKQANLNSDDSQEDANPWRRRSVVLLHRARIIWKHRRAFQKRFLTLTAISTLVVFLWPKHYAATSTLMPPNDNSLSLIGMLMGGGGDVSSESTASNAGAIGSLLGLNSQGQLFVHAAQSRSVEDRMIQRFDLMNVYKTSRIEDCRKRLEWYTDVQEDRKSGTIDITVTDRDPRRAAEMANAYVEELNRLMLGVNSTTARQEREVTRLRVDQAARELADASKELAEFASKNTTLAPDEQGKAAVELSTAIEGQLIASQADLKSLEELYTPDNQRVYSARARVQELQRQLEKANSAGLKGESTEGSLPSVRKLPLVGVEYLDLYRKVKVREQVLIVLTQEYELARIRENHQVSTVSVMDEAVVPTKKSFPPRALFLLALLFVSFWGVVSSILLQEWWETSGESDPWKRVWKPSLN